MTEQKARAVYAVLIAECGANLGDLDSFVCEFSKSEPTGEWRFQGALGFGGKFRYPQMCVDCYREDENPRRLDMIASANAKLKELSQEGCNERLDMRFETVKQQYSELANLSRDDMEKLHKALTSAGATWGQAAQRIGVAIASITKVQPVLWSKVELIHSVAMFQFAVAADVTVVMRAESAMIEAIANETYTPADDAIFFSCITS